MMNAVNSHAKPEDSSIEIVSILGVKVHNVTFEQAVDLARGFMNEPGLHQIATVNPEFIMIAQSNKAFRQVLNGAALCLPDGVGLLLASRWLGQPISERVAGSDFVYKIAAEAAKQGWRLFLLGAAPGVADKAAELLRRRYAGLQIAGAYPGSPDLSENEALIDRINRSGADVLYVAYGAPAQDLWIDRNADAFDNLRIAIGVGGSLDFITGLATRAPRWMQRLGLEWLYRLIREPWRWKRMLALPRFAFRVLVSRFTD